MNLSRQYAQNIVREINSIIGENINIMDSKGIIIASSDKDRIDTFHGGAKKIVDENLKQLLVHYDGEYEGAFTGTNIPIEFNSTIVGVIGVTGPDEEVLKYGKIIKKMSEILFLEQFYAEQKYLDKRIRERFLRDWIESTPSQIDNDLIKRGEALNVDITVPRRIIMISVIPKDDNIKEEKLQEYLDKIESIIREKTAFDNANEVITLSKYIIAGIKIVKDPTVINLFQDIKKEIENDFPVNLAIGIDSYNDNYSLINNSYSKSLKALRTSMRDKNHDIKSYDNINMEIFLNEISESTKREYINNIFKGCSDEEIHNWILILEPYIESEGSLDEASKRLFIHKNTLQYNLIKLKDKTGYDPRSLKYSSLYYNAIHFYRDIYQERLY